MANYQAGDQHSVGIVPLARISDQLGQSFDALQFDNLTGSIFFTANSDIFKFKFNS